jgi:hypothetical protein
MRAVWVVLTAAVIACPHPGSAAMPASPALVIADFDGQTCAEFPKGWQTRDSQAAAARVYRVSTEDGEQFLSAVAQGDSVQIGLPVSFTFEQYPLMSWRWRVRELPSGADEREAATNDSAAGVYVVFKGGLGGLLPRAIKYVWSTHEPRGTALPSPRYPNARILVLQSGTEGAGAWRTETVNVVEDYRRLFAAEPPEPRGIAVLTDADNTRTRAVADYDDFRALPLTTAATPPSQLTSQRH